MKNVMHWDDERSLDNGIIVTLSRGWAFDPQPREQDALHVMGFDTVKEARQGVGNAQECTCEYCLGLVD